MDPGRDDPGEEELESEAAVPRLQHNDTLSLGVAVRPHWDQDALLGDGDESPLEAGRLLQQIDTLRRGFGDLEETDDSGSCSSSSDGASSWIPDTPMTPFLSGNIRRRNLQIVRLSASVLGLPAAVAEAGTFVRVAVESTELGNHLTGRQVVTTLQHSRDPVYVSEECPLFFHIEDSKLSPAPRAILVIDIFQAIKCTTSFLGCRCASQGRKPMHLAKVQILLKDVIHKGQNSTSFNCPIQVSQRGRLVDMGVLEAKVSHAPGNGRCVLGICQDHRVFNHNHKLCFVIDGLADGDPEARSPEEGHQLTKGFCVRKVTQTGALGMAEAQSIPSPDGAAELQIWDHGKASFVTWATVSPPEAVGRESLGSPPMEVTGHMMPTLSLEPLERACRGRDAGSSAAYAWAPAALPDFPASVVRWWDNPILPPGVPPQCVYLLESGRAHQWALMEGDELHGGLSDFSSKERGVSVMSSGQTVKSILKTASKFSDLHCGSSGFSESVDGPDWTDREREEARQEDNQIAGLQIDRDDAASSAKCSSSPSLNRADSLFNGNISNSDSDSEDELATVVSLSTKARRSRSMRQALPATESPQERPKKQDAQRQKSIIDARGRLTMTKSVHFNVATESFNEAAQVAGGCNGEDGKQLVAHVFHGMPGGTELKHPLWTGKALHGLEASHSKGGAFVVPADIDALAAVVEFDFEKQILAPVLVALAVEMQRRACAANNSTRPRP